MKMREDDEPARRRQAGGADSRATVRSPVARVRDLSFWAKGVHVADAAVVTMTAWVGIASVVQGLALGYLWLLTSLAWGVSSVLRLRAALSYLRIEMNLERLEGLLAERLRDLPPQ